jgi:hypothetical protein
LQQIVRIGVSDADQLARKAARQLYWVMARRPAWTSAMTALLYELDPATQKHIQAEIKVESSELKDYLRYLQIFSNSSVSLSLSIYQNVVPEGQL